MGNWNSRTTVRKGNLGESIVRLYLEHKGYIVYAPETEGAHAFDRLCVSRNKQTVFIAEVKTKPRRKFYPDTGINTRHFNEYKFIQDKYHLDIFIFFVDEVKKMVYGNYLRKLIEPREVEGRSYPLTQSGIIYFPLIAMRDVAPLSEEVSGELLALSNRTYTY